MQAYDNAAAATTPLWPQELIMSDSDFDDDDDLLLALVRQTQVKGPSAARAADVARNSVPQNPQPPSSSVSGNDAESRLFRADGEIAILRAQLHNLQQQRQDEIATLKQSHGLLKKQADDQLNALKFAVDRLEDEKKFLGNELKSTSAKKRRLAPDSAFLDPERATVSPGLSSGTGPGLSSVIRVHSDASLFIDHVWNYCINGSGRTSLAFLSKICVNRDIRIRPDFAVFSKVALNATVVDFLMAKKSLRLDDLVFDFVDNLMRLVKILLHDRSVLAVPFLLLLVHASLSFKTSAVSEKLVRHVLADVVVVCKKFLFLLDSLQDEDDFVNFHDVQYQQVVLENLTLVSCIDILECLVALSSGFLEDFARSLWSQEVISVDFLQTLLPENTERFKSTAQVNIVFGVVEMLTASISTGSFAFNDDSIDDAIIKSLLKVFLIDIPIKEDFMFYGLNRVIGNNGDFLKVELVIPRTENILKKSIVSTPDPILKTKLLKKEQFHASVNHDLHVLNLKVKTLNLFEALVLVRGSLGFFSLKELIKLIVRVVSLEQNALMKSPRSRFVNLRIAIIASFIRLLYYVFDDIRNINSLIYPETLYELFVVLMRIAFVSDELSTEGTKLLADIRLRSLKSVFNKYCETKSREISHLSKNAGASVIAETESDFPNGLEFAYEPETIELAREILGICVNHEEADNLYFNMNCEEPQDFQHDEDVEMDEGEELEMLGL